MYDSAEQLHATENLGGVACDAYGAAADKT